MALERSMKIKIGIGVLVLGAVIVGIIAASSDPMDDPSYRDGYNEGRSVIQQELGQTILHQGKSKQEIVNHVLGSYDRILRMQGGKERDEKYLEGFRAGVKSVLDE